MLSVSSEQPPVLRVRSCGLAAETADAFPVLSTYYIILKLEG